MDWDGARLGNRLPRHLRLLADIARLGSLTRVAAAAGISQPAVTKAQAELEDISARRCSNARDGACGRRRWVNWRCCAPAACATT